MRAFKPVFSWIAFAGLTALAALPTGVQAGAHALNPTCESLRLASVRVAEASMHLSKDYCALPDSELPGPIRALLSQLGPLHEKAAELFQVSVSELLPRPFELVIQKSPLGPMSSAVKPTSAPDGIAVILELGVFADWNGEPINAGVYEHELGHVIGANSNNPHLPPIYNELSSSTLLVEMIADLTALHVAGAIVSPEPSLPACLQQFRSVGLDQTYNRPADEFTPWATWNRVTSCCQSLGTAETHTAHSRQLCDAYTALNPRPPVAHLGSTPFNDEFYARNKDSIDPHQLALPLTSFLAALEKETGLEMAPRLMQAMRDANLETPRSYSCRVPKLARFLPVQSESHHSVAQVLGRLDVRLPGTAWETFRRLWASHNLDLAVRMAESDSQQLAAVTAMEHGDEAYKALYTHAGFFATRRLRATGCWVEGNPGFLASDLPGCNYSCTRLPLAE